MICECTLNSFIYPVAQVEDMVSLQERVSSTCLQVTRKSKHENNVSLVAKNYSTQTRTHVSVKEQIKNATHLYVTLYSSQDIVLSRKAFQAWRQYIYNNNLKKLSVACCQQKQTVLMQGI